MKKSDLKSGMIMETRDGDQGIVLLNSSQGDVIGGMGYDNSIWFPLSTLDDYFYRKTFNARDQICKIYDGNNNFELGSAKKLIWERKEKVDITIEAIAKVFGIEVEQVNIVGKQ